MCESSAVSFNISLYFEGRLSFIIVYQLIIADPRKDCCSRGVTSTITKLLTWSQEHFVVLRHFCKFFSNTFEIQRTLKKINDKRLGMKTLHVYKMFCAKKSYRFWKLKRLRTCNRLYALLWRSSLPAELENLTPAAGDRASTSDKLLLSAKESLVTRWTDKISLRSRRLEVVGTRKDGCVPVLSFTHYFQAPATQDKIR